MPLLDLAAAVSAEDALITLREIADLCDCDLEIDLLGDEPGSYAYAVRIRDRTSLRTVLLGTAAREGGLGRAVRDLLAVMA